MSNYKRYVASVLSLLSFVGANAYAVAGGSEDLTEPTRNVRIVGGNLIMTNKTQSADDAVNRISTKLWTIFKDDEEVKTIQRALEIWKCPVLQEFLLNLPVSKFTQSGVTKSEDEKDEEYLSKLDDVWSVCISVSSKSLADKELSHYIQKNKEKGTFKLLPRSTSETKNLQPVYDKLKTNKSLDHLASLVINKCSKAWVISEAPAPTKNDLIRADGLQVVTDDSGNEKVVPNESRPIDNYTLRPNQNPVSGEYNTPSVSPTLTTHVSIPSRGKNNSTSIVNGVLPFLLVLGAGGGAAAYFGKTHLLNQVNIKNTPNNLKKETAFVRR